MAAKPLQLVNNRPTEVEVTIESTGASDAGKVVGLGADGLLDPSVMPTGIGADVSVLPAFENLAAGDEVNIFDDSGTMKVRKADASAADAARSSDGFVIANVTAPANATVYHDGTNTQKSGLTPGAIYALSHSTPGGVILRASASSTAGHCLQIIGKAISATAITTQYSTPIIRG